MKKILKPLFLLSLMGMAITACNNTPAKEELIYSDAWTSDAVEHWHNCISQGHEGEKGSLAEHTFDEGVVTPATYEADGYTTYTCTVCHYQYQGNLTHKLSHNFSEDWSYDTDTHWHACLDEGYTDLKADEGEHDYDLGVVTPATYDAAGYITYTCKICGHKDIQPGDEQIPHQFETGWSYNATTHWHACKDEGYETLKGQEASHDFEVTVIPATHETPEYEIHECKICHYIETTEGGQAVDHNYASTWTYNTTQHWHACTDEGYSSLKKDTANHTFEDVVTPSTFETQGYTTHTCSVCGYSYKDNYTDVLPHNFESTWSVDSTAGTHYHACTDEGYTDLRADEALHTWNAGTITKPASETETGIKEFECTVCGHKKTEIIPMTTHHYSETWSNDNTNHWHACTDAGCESVDGLAAHVWNSGEHHQATYALDAYTVYTCTVCGYSHSESEANSRLSIQDEAHLTFALNEAQSGWVVTGNDGHLYDNHDYVVYIPETHTESDVTLPVVEIGEEAFLNGDINRLVMGDNLEKISRSAFNNCSFLSIVELGKDVKTIQTNAFAGCYRMTEVFNQSLLNIKLGSSTFGGIARNAAAVVTDPEDRGVLAEGDSTNEYVYTKGETKILAYYTNPGDTKTNVQLNYDEIKPYAFFDVSNVTGVTFSAKVNKIGHHAFLNSGLASLNIPATVTSIGESAFENCDDLAEATVANAAISNYQFKDCDSLTTVSAADVTSIGMGAFELSGLESFTIGSKVTSIGASAFASTYIASISIPANVTTIGEGAFYNCPSLKTLSVDGDNANYASQNNVLYNKDFTALLCYPAGISIDAWPTTPQGVHPFVVPITVKSIDSNAFYKAQLDAIVIPGTIESIGDTPFLLAENLVVIMMLDGSYNPVQTFAGTYYSVSTGVLYQNTVHKNGSGDIESIEYYRTLVSYPAKLPTTKYQPEAATRAIATSAFEGAEGLEFIFLGSASGDCVNSIGTRAFANCTHLYQVKMIAGGTNFGLDCFENVPLKTLDFMGTNASNFKLLNGGLSNLHSAGINKILCSDLVDTNKPSYLLWNDVTEEYDVVGSLTFELPEGTTTIVGQSFATTYVESIFIPASVKVIEPQAFAQCVYLKEVIFEEGSQLEVIGDQAFAQSALQSITIPASVKVIGEQAFAQIAFSDSESYYGGSLVEHEGKIYKCNGDIGPGAWDENNWTLVSDNILESLTFEENSQLCYIGKQAFGGQSKIASALDLPNNFSNYAKDAFDEYSNEKTYAKYDIAAKDSNLYLCIEDINSPESWDVAKWTQIGTIDENNAVIDTLIIGEQAFGNCASIVVVNLSSFNSVAIGDQAFAGCSALSIVILPSDYSLGVAVFYGDINISNASAATMPLFFFDGSDNASAILTSFGNSVSATGGACTVIYMTDMDDPSTVVYTLKLELSFYSESTPTNEQWGVLDYLSANYPDFTYSYWHLEGGVPTLYVRP